MSEKASKAQPETEADSDESRLRKALQEREKHLKEQLEKAEALPDTDSGKHGLVNQFKRHLDEVRKDLRK